jgi:hypothetical protein
MPMSVTSAARVHPAPSANRSTFFGTRTMKNTLDRAHKVHAVQHEASPKVKAASKTMDAISTGFQVDPKVLSARVASASGLRSTLYYALLAGYPPYVNGKMLNVVGDAHVSAFTGQKNDEGMEVAKLSAGDMLKTLKNDFIPSADSQAGSQPGAIAAATQAVFTAFDELQRGGGMSFYKTHYEDDTQVYDGYVALNARTGEIRQVATYTDG